jgi:hypothetical protein
MEAQIRDASEAPFGPYLWPDSAPDLQALECLEASITELWGHINAATYRFLELVGEFDRRQGWALHGLANCAQWLNWQCGIGEGAAREKVRVARSLEGLPAIGAAFRRGVISYSKVRAMTRIATPDNEADLLNVAEHGTAAHVERLVRKYRRVERLEDAARANGQHRERAMYFFYDEDGSMILHAKLPPEIGAVVKTAIEEAIRVLENENENEDADTPAPVETESTVSAETIAVPDPASSHDRFAAKRADALRLLAEAFLTRQSDAVGSVADRFQVVVHIDQRLLTSAGAVAANGATAAANRSEIGAERCNLGAERCELADGRALALETVRRLGCDASVVGMIDTPTGEPLSVGRKTRSIPPALQRALKARDGGCRFPGCNHSQFTEGHHVRNWADGGETKLGNLITLCRFHHRLIHEGGFGLLALDDAPERDGDVSARDMFVFTRPDGTRIERNGRICFSGNNFVWRDGVSRPAVFAVNHQAGLAIDWRTSRCQWLGERMDYGLAVQALIQRRDSAVITS